MRGGVRSSVTAQGLLIFLQTGAEAALQRRVSKSNRLMALPSRPQDHGPPVSEETPSAPLLPRKALLPDLGRLLPRSRRRGLEGVGATPRPTTQIEGAKLMYLNRVTLIGFTGQEPKTFATQSGKEITRLSVATTRRYQQDSEWKEKTQWHDCVLYGGPAQYVEPRQSHTRSHRR